MTRLRLTIAYDGMPFKGWQSQENANAIQDLIEKSIVKIIGTPIRIHAAGRTDAGVHATGQVAHFDLTENSIAPDQWPLAINRHLPPTIRIMACRIVPQNFHARFSAIGKTYLYNLRLGRVLPPHENGRVWLVPSKLDVALLEKAANHFVGTHNFAAFAANRGHFSDDTTRTIHSIVISRRGPCVKLRFSGDGFLYRMVRLMTGGFVRFATGKMPWEDLTSYLESPEKGKCSFCAPPDGLTLERVLY